MATPSGETPPGEGARSRWRLAAVAAFVVVAAAASWWAATRGDGAREPAPQHHEIVPNRFAVVPFENRTGDPSLDAIGVLAADRIAQGLAGIEADQHHPRADIVPSARIRELLAAGTPAAATAVTDATGARIVVAGSFVRRGELLEFDGSITDTSLDEIVHAFEPVSAPMGDPGAALATLRDHAVMVVTDHVSPVLGVFADERFPKIEAYQLFLTGLRTYWSSGDTIQALALLQRALEVDPDFNRVRLWILMPAPETLARPILDELERRSDQLTARQLLFIQAKKAQLASDWETRYRALRDLINLAPGYRYLYRFAASAAVTSNRPEAAVEYWERATALEGEDQGDSLSAAEALHLLGRYDEELAVGEFAVRQGPNGLWERVTMARALVGLGRLDEAEQLADGMLQTYQSGVEPGEFMLQVSRFLRAHGGLDEARAMAGRAAEWFARVLESDEDAGTRLGYLQALLLGDRFDELVTEIGEIRDPNDLDDLDRLVLLGIGSARTGDRTTAEEAAARLKAMGDPPDAPHRGRATYMLACISAHLGDREEALRLVRRALAEGMRYGIYHHNNPFNEPLRNDPEFQEIMRPKG